MDPFRTSLGAAEGASASFSTGPDSFEPTAFHELRSGKRKGFAWLPWSSLKKAKMSKSASSQSYESNSASEPHESNSAPEVRQINGRGHSNGKAKGRGFKAAGRKLWRAFSGRSTNGTGGSESQAKETICATAEEIMALGQPSIPSVSRSLSGTERPHGADQNMDDTNDQFPMHLKSSQTSSKGDSEDIHFGRSPSERLPVSEKSRRRPPASPSSGAARFGEVKSSRQNDLKPDWGSSIAGDPGRPYNPIDDIALDDRAFIETEGAVEQLSTMMGSQMSLDERPESAEPSSRLYWLSIYGDIPPAVERALAGGLSGEALLETPVEVIAYVSTFEDWSQGLRYREERKPVVSRPIEIRKSKRGLQVTGCVQARHVAQVKASSKGLRFAQPLLGPATVTATSPAKTSDCANLHLNLPASQPVGEKVDGAWTPLPAGEQRPPCTPSEEAASVLGGPSSFGRPNRLDFERHGEKAVPVQSGHGDNESVLSRRRSLTIATEVSGGEGLMSPLVTPLRVREQQPSEPSPLQDPGHYWEGARLPAAVPEERERGVEPVVGLPLMRDGDLGEASMLVPASQNLQAEAPVEIDVAAPNVLERGRGEAPGLAGERPGLDAEVGATVMEAVAAAPLPEARIPHLDEAVWEIGENGVGNREGVLIGVFDEGWDPCIVDRVKGLAYVVSKKRLCAAATVLENGYGFLHTRDQLLASSTECNQNCHEAHGMQMLRIVHANAGGTPIFYWNHAGMADPTAYESTLLYAAKIIIRTAGRRRCVINLSLDMDTSGGHDEWEPLAADIDGFNESTGAVFVVAAGNSHVREGYHARFSATNVAGARELSFDLRGVSCSEGFTSVKCDEVKERAKSGSVKGPGCRDHRVELWFDSHAGSHLAIKVRELVDGKWEDTETVRFQPQENVQYLPGKAGTVTYRQQFREDEPEDGFSLLLNLPEASLPPGKVRHFRIVFDNFPPEVKIDAWAARGCAIIAKGPGPEPPVDAAELGAAGPITLSNLAGGRQSIVVGAAVDRHFTTGTDYLPCSAAGRTRTDYEQPCVLACGQYHHYPRVDLTASPVSGTSHATAAVTAVVARHLSACGALVELETASAEEQRIDVRSRLCKVFEMKGAMHDSRRGFGFLDIDTVQKFLRQLE